MKLLIIRHAIAEDRKAFAETGNDDDLRPLTDAGAEKMRAVASGLRAVVSRIDVLAASPLTRAQQTAAIVADAYGDVATITIEELRPDAAGPELLRWLRTQPSAGVIAIVGHEPHLGHLASWLLTGREEPFIALKKGGALLLDFGEFVQAGLPRLVWALPPKLLRSLAPADG